MCPLDGGRDVLPIDVVRGFGGSLGLAESAKGAPQQFYHDLLISNNFI